MKVGEIRSTVAHCAQPISTRMTLRKRTKSCVVAKKTLQTTNEALVKNPRAHKKIRAEKSTSAASSSTVGMQILGSSIEKQENSKYQEIICRLTAAEDKKLKRLLSMLPKKEENIAELVQAIQQAPTYHEAVFTSPDWPLYALVALKQGLIDEYQFGTLQLYWSIGQYHRSYHDVQICPLFMPDGTNNLKAVELIQSTSHGSMKSKGLFETFTVDTHFLTDQQLKKFIEEMKELPPSEQQFFIVPDIQKTNWTTTVSQGIHELGINIFSRLEGDMRMIPSLGMMQTMLNVKFGNQAVKINPVLGLSSIEQMKKIAQRDMALAFPGVKLPEEADTYPAPWYDFTYHDFYHAIVVSGIPLTLRSKMIDIADFTLEMMKASAFTPTSPEGQTLCSIREVLIDMETAWFRQDFSGIQTAESLFWNQLQDAFVAAFFNPSYTKYDLDTSILFFQKVAQKLILDKDGEKCGLTLDSLKNANNQPMNYVFGPTIQHLKLLQFMLNAVIKSSSKVKINPCTQTEIETEKYIYSLGLKRNKENSRSPQSETTDQTLSQEFGITPSEWLELEREKEFSSLQLIPLLLAKISVKQILSLEPETRKQVIENSILIAALLKSGVSWEKVSHPETLTNFVKSKKITPILLQMGATLDEIEKLPENLRALLEKKSYKLESIAEKGYRFELFTTLEREKLKLFITNNFELLDLFPLETIQKMTLEERFRIVVEPEWFLLTLLTNKIKQLLKQVLR